MTRSQLPPVAGYMFEGEVTGHAGAYVKVSLGPFAGPPGEGDVQALAIGVGELLAQHGQFVTSHTISPVALIPDALHAGDVQRRLNRLLTPDEARAENEQTWTRIDEFRQHARARHPSDG